MGRYQRRMADRQPIPSRAELAAARARELGQAPAPAATPPAPRRKSARRRKR